MESVLVTGGAGFIGHHLVKRLIQDCRVVIIDNLSNGKISNIPDHQNVTFYRENIRNKETLADIVKRERIDTCVHLAANTSVTESIGSSDEITDVNISGTASVLEACSKGSVRNFVFASSAAVYGEAKILPVSEDEELKPISPYGASKVAGENLVSFYQKSGKIPHAVTLRFFNVYGEGQNPRYAGVITRFAERLSKGLAPIIYGDGRQTRDFVSVNDVVDAIVLAMKSAVSSGTFNIGTGTAVTVSELARNMTRRFGLHVKPLYQNTNPEEIAYSCAATTKAEEILKFIAKEDLSYGLQNLLHSLIRVVK